MAGLIGFGLYDKEALNQRTFKPKKNEQDFSLFQRKLSRIGRKSKLAYLVTTTAEYHYCTGFNCDHYSNGWSDGFQQ